MTLTGTGTPNALRTRHDTAVFAFLAAQGPKSRADIVRATGISKPTVLDVVERLSGIGLVEDAGASDSARPGPRARLYGVRSQLAFGVTIEIHGDRAYAEVQDVGGTLEVLDSTEIKDREIDIDDVIELIRRACEAAGLDPKDAAVTVVATGGGVDPQTGGILAWDLPHWRRDLASELSGFLGGAVEMENETNLRAIAERRFGAAQDVDDFVLIALGAGIGGGIMHGERLHRGRSGLAGELGYQPITIADPEGGVRVVPVRELVDGPAIQALAERYGFAGESAGAVVEQAVVAFSTTRDDRADAFLDELADRVSVIGGSLLVILDPECIVLADEIGIAGGDELAGRVAVRLARILGSLRAPVPEVRASLVEVSPIRRGAMALLRQRLREHVLRGAGYPEPPSPGAIA